MAVSEPKKKMEKVEVIEVLRRNARLFKDEPDFVTYIVDLAMYLIENYLEHPEIAKTAKTEKKPFKPDTPDVEKVYRVFERFSSGQSQMGQCPVCGHETGGKRKCPNCDAMTF